jgi:hypothetical protein
MRHLVGAIILLTMLFGAPVTVAQTSNATTMRHVEAYGGFGDWFRAFLSAALLPSELDERYIAWAESRAGKIAPVLLMELARRSQEINLTRALQWHAAGQLRLNINLSQCKNVELVWPGKAIVDKMSDDLVKYRISHPDEARAADKWALAWDAEQPASPVSPAWDCLTVINIYKATYQKPIRQTLPSVVSAEIGKTIRIQERRKFMTR